MSSNNSIYNPICDALNISHTLFEYGTPKIPEDATSKNVSGDMHPFWGQKLTDEHKKAISDFMKSYVRKPEHNINISLGLTGFKHSEEAKFNMSVAHSGELNGFYGLRWGENGMREHPGLGMKRTDESRAKMSESHKGHTDSDETKLKKSESKKIWYQSNEHAKGMLGKSHNDDTKSKMSIAAKNRKRLTCPHCKKDIPVNVINRFHNDNCKNKDI